MLKIVQKYQVPIICFLIWRLIHIGLQLLLQLTTEQSVNILKLTNPWATNWDGSYYLSIATEGYASPLFVFFPLFPILISCVNYLGIPPSIASLLVSNLAAFIATVLLYVLTEEKTNTKHALQTTVLFLSFPTSLFLIAGYTESLFIALSIGTFLAIEKNKLTTATFLGALSFSTRITGFVLASSIFFNKKIIFKKKLIFFFGSSTGLILYMLYQLTFHQSPLLFLTDQSKWNSQGEFGVMNITKIPSYIINEINIVEKRYFIMLDSLAIILGLASVPMANKKFGMQYSVYVLLISLMYILSGRLISNSRYLLAAFPIFMTMPLYIKNKNILYIIIATSFFLQTLLTIQFLLHRWVA